MFSSSLVSSAECRCQEPPETQLEFQILDRDICGLVQTFGLDHEPFLTSRTAKPDKIVTAELQALLAAFPSHHRPQFAYQKHRAVQTQPVREKQLSGVLDDFYLNVLHWGSCQGQSRLAIACVGEVLVLNPELNEVTTYGGPRSPSATPPLPSRPSTHDSITAIITQTLGGIVNRSLEGTAHGVEPFVVERNSMMTDDTPHLRIGGAPPGSNSARLSTGPHAAFLRRGSDPTGGGSPVSGDRMEYTSVRWDYSGRYIALGTRCGDIEIWDTEVERLLTTLNAHCQRVGVLDWVPGEENRPLLTSGSRDKTLMIHDLRSSSAAVEIDKHKQEVCGLAWRPANQQDPVSIPRGSPSRATKDVSDTDVSSATGSKSFWDLAREEAESCKRAPQTDLDQTRVSNLKTLTSAVSGSSYYCGGGGTRNSVATLASGGNDNKVYLWELGQTSPVAKFADHSAAVKALAWAPIEKGVLASGGGTNDRTIRLWDTENKIELCSSETESQVCNLIWSPKTLELLSSHGYTLNQVNLWDLRLRQSENKIRLRKAETLTGHTSRVLFMAQSPNQESVATVSGDGRLKIWNVFS